MILIGPNNAATADDLATSIAASFRVSRTQRSLLPQISTNGRCCVGALMSQAEIRAPGVSRGRQQITLRVKYD